MRSLAQRLERKHVPEQVRQEETRPNGGNSS